MSIRYSLAGWSLATGAALLLAACGGGGSGTSSTALQEAPAARSAAAPKSITVPARNEPTEAANRNGPRSRMYIVQMADAPALAYIGDIAGYQATKPAAGSKINPNNPNVASYVGYLASRHDTTLAAAGGGRKAYSYGYTFNGFAAEMSDAQAMRLATMPGVLSVVKDELRRIDTSSTPAFLGMTGPTGFWTRTGAKGENVIIGVVDDGITPEHPSFSDRTDANGNLTKDGKLGYQQIPGWHGKCEPGVAFNASHCNQKLIGARFYNEGYGGAAGVLEVLPYEFISPRGYAGHGTHTASTAGGNANIAATGLAAPFGKVSGLAPRARIAAYKVCWGVGGTENAGCFTTDSVAAIDQAVADGVDVINFSISGSRTNFLDPVEVAFLFAADAGVFVATSAGNSGPDASTVAHPSPWVTTVAAGTHNRDGRGSVTLGNGVTMTGPSWALAVGPKPLVRSRDSGVAGADVTTLARCYGAADGGVRLDAAKVSGKIVVCERGGNALVNKAVAVKAAGGVGMLLVNTPTSAQTQLALVFAVPGIHLASTDYAVLNAYAQTAGATATINQANAIFDVPAPLTASFSSRGPLLAAGGDLLKPDIIAPGQDIMAGVAPYTYGGEYFSLLSGTSMSSPHIAGIAALFKELKPTWSPMAIKSALMTTAGDVLDGGTPAPSSNPILIFRQGAGHVRPNDATDPGLVFNTSFNDWLAFLCGTGQLTASYCPQIRIDPSNLNVPSIAIGDLPGTQTVTRRVTNVGNSAATYTPSYAGMAGFTVEVLPASLQLAKGESKTFTVKFTRTAAALNTYTGGQLTLGDGTHTVRVPMVVRPLAMAAPAQVSGSYSVTFGYDGPFSATPRGLVAAALSNGTVADDPSNGACGLAAPNAQIIEVVVPAATTYARFSLFDADVNAGSDLDLCVHDSTGAQVGSSGSGTSAEEVNLTNPAAGTYRVVVQGWGVVGSTPFKLHSWVLGSTAAGNMTVSAPANAVTGAVGNIELSFSGLAAGTKYLGSVAYSGVAGLPAPTIVRVDQP